MMSMLNGRLFSEGYDVFENKRTHGISCGALYQKMRIRDRAVSMWFAMVIVKMAHSDMYVRIVASPS